MPPNIGFYSETAESHLRIKNLFIYSHIRHTSISAEVFQGASCLETLLPRSCVNNVIF
jgi:hypothetical protein